MDPIQDAKMLFNGIGSTTDEQELAYLGSTGGIAMSDSDNGMVDVDLGGMTVSDSGEQHVRIPTTVSVKEGDEVEIATYGYRGSARTMMVIGVIGGGDRTDESISDVAENAVKSVEEFFVISGEQPQTPDDSTWQSEGWSRTQPMMESDSDDELWVSVRAESVAGYVEWSEPSIVQVSADLKVMRNAIVATVASGYVSNGDLNAKVSECSAMTQMSGRITSEISRVEGLVSDAEGSFSDAIGEARSDMSSAIEQTASSILQQVSETYVTDGDSQSAIDAALSSAKSYADGLDSAIRASDGPIEVAKQAAISTSSSNIQSAVSQKVSIGGSTISDISFVMSQSASGTDFFHSSGGVASDSKVHVDGEKVSVIYNSTNYSKMTASGFEVVKDGSSVASFGDSTRIGNELEAHVSVSSSAIQMLRGQNVGFEMYWDSGTIALDVHNGSVITRKSNNEIWCRLGHSTEVASMIDGKWLRPVYGLRNSSNGEIFHTTDANEYNALKSQGWTGGISFYAFY